MADTEKNAFVDAEALTFFVDLLSHHDGIKRKVHGQSYTLKKEWVGEGPGQQTWGLRIYSHDGFPGDSISWHHAIKCLRPNANL